MKKLLSILVAISLILTSAIPAFADDSTTSKGLEQAILQVKGITTIPSDYKVFQYSSNTYEENGKKRIRLVFKLEQRRLQRRHIGHR